MENKVVFYRQVFERFLVDRLCFCNFFIVFLHVLRLKVRWKSRFSFTSLRSASFSRFPVLSLDVQVSDQELASCKEVCRSDGLKNTLDEVYGCQVVA